MTDSPIIDDLKFDDVPEDRPTPKKTVPPKKTTTRTPAYREGMFIEPVTRFYATTALGLFPFAPKTAEMVAMQAEACAKSWDDWARTSPQIRRILMPLVNFSAGAQVLSAHIPIALAVAMEMRPDSPFAAMAEQYIRNLIGAQGDVPE